MGKIAGELCSEIILTSEDSYDEDPRIIINDIAKGISSGIRVTKIIDRREAIKTALRLAKPGDTVIITGKGAEPWLMGPGGSKIPWDDREVIRGELKNLKQ